MTTSRDRSRIRTLLAAHGVTDVAERWGEIITCVRELDDEITYRWGHPSCGDHGYQPDPVAAWDAAREHLTGCTTRRSPGDIAASPDALIFSLVIVDADTGWKIIPELDTTPDETP